jgi:hypothetical protein
MPDAPLPLCRVLEEEFASIHGGTIERYDWSVVAEDIGDLQALIADLQRAWHIDQTLRDPFARTIDALARPLPAAELKAAAAADLTALLDRPELIDRLAAALEASLDPYLEKWRSQNPQREDRRHLDRLRIENIFQHSLCRLYDRRLESLYAKMHDKEQAALCLSGGGIRSATFALGVLQGLAHHNLLNNFHYISTVSGGGYIGAWLSSWIAGHREGIQGVSQELQRRGESKLDPEPAPIHHLRAYSNYLTPQIGLFSGDTWALVGTYARNVTMNLLIQLPLLFAAVLLPRIMIAAIDQMGEVPRLALLFLFVAAASGTFAIAYLTLRRPSVQRIDTTSPAARMRHGQRSFFLKSLLPLFVASILLVLYWAAAVACNFSFTMLQFAVFGLLMQLGGFLGIGYFRGRRLVIEAVLFAASGLLGGVMLYYDALLFPAGDPLLLATFGPPLFLLNFLGAATIYVAAVSRTRYSFDEDLEWWARTGGWTLLFAAAWAVSFAVVIYGPMAVLQAPKWYAAGAGTVVAATLGVLRALRNALTRGATSDKKTNLLNLALSWLAPACFIVIVCALSLVASFIVHDWLADAHLNVWNLSTFIAGMAAKRQLMAASEVLTVHTQSFQSPVLFNLFVFLTALVALGFFFSWIVDINVFSMHSMYRNRLTRAYLGASRERRRPNPFTGFDPADSREMHELAPEAFDAHSFYDFLAFIDLFSGTRRGTQSGTWGPEVARLLQRIDQLEPHCSRELRGRRRGEPLNPELARRFVRALNQLVHDPKLAETLGGAAGAEEPGPELHRANRRRLEEAFPKHIVPIEYTTEITQNTILDLTMFVRQLDPSEGHPLAHALWPRLSPTLRHLIKAGVAAPPAETRAAILRDLKAILPGNSLDAAALGAGLELDGTIASLAESNPVGGDRIILNRLVLEQAFPRILRRWRGARPFHVVNTALNLVQGEDLAWQERKAESFTMTALHAGAARLGFRRSHHFGDPFGFSLPTAVTISGAAASPNMGNETSTTVALLMTLFNVRLGWWVGNPGPWGEKTYTRSSPKWSLIRIVQEALGLTNDRRSYVYLSDGGHFENLGLYEMVRRRCHTIVVSDAGQDYRYAFQDLGNAVRKIRVDLGIPIEIREHKIFPRDENKLGKYCAVGKILYNAVDKGAPDGTLIYLKPAVYWSEPMDVYNYGRENIEFPHEPTSDQFFSESQFESYRMLGQHTIDAICEQRGWRAQSLHDFADRALDYLAKKDDSSSS